MKYTNDKEIAEKILAELDYELEGICSYDCLYKMLEENEMHEMARTIEKIASDEYRHVSKLLDMMDVLQIAIPQKTNALLDKVEEIFD